MILQNEAKFEKESTLLKCLNTRYGCGFPTYLGRMLIGHNRKALIMSDLPGKTLKEMLYETDPAEQLTILELMSI